MELFLNKLREQRFKEEWIPMRETLIETFGEDFCNKNLEIEDNYYMHEIILEAYLCMYYLGDYQNALSVLKNFKKTYVNDGDIKNTDYVMEKIYADHQIIATYNVDRQPKDEELIMCYGDFALTSQSLICNNPIQRHYLFQEYIGPDLEEYDSVWDYIDQIYVINLKERVDRWVHMLREFGRMNIPFSKVTKIEAIKVDHYRSDLNGHIGCAQSHLKALEDAQEHQYQNIIVFEDDFCFTSNIEKNKQQIQTFFERKYDFDVCLLAASKYHCIKPYDDLLSLSYQVCTTCSGYLLSKNGQEKVLLIWKNALQNLIETGNHGLYACDRSWSILQSQNKFFLFTNKIGFQSITYSNNTHHLTLNLD